MKQIKSWMSCHPFLTALFGAAFGSLATCIAFREDWTFTGCLIYSALAVLVGLLIRRHPKVMMIGVLVFTLAIPPNMEVKAQSIPEPQAGAGCAAAAVAVVVIVIGGIVIYKVVKFCQRKFPKGSPGAGAGGNTGGNTNTPPATASGDTNTYAAVFNYDELGSCSFDDPCYGGSGDGYGTGAGLMAVAAPNESGTTFTLQLHVDQDDEYELVITPQNLTANSGPEAVQSFREFQEEILTNYNVAILGTTGPSFFSSNGVPVDYTPIEWDSDRRLVKVNYQSLPSYTITVERSSDMTNWIQVLKTEVEVGTTIQMEDTTWEKRQFYRFSGFLSD